jgi:hypothetical protein
MGVLFKKYNCKSVLLVLLLLCTFFCLPIYAQKGSGYVYVDSTAEDSTQNVILENDVADTFLIKNALQIKPNWLTIIRSEKELAYAPTLQNKLQQLQKETAQKLQNTGNNISWLARVFTSKITQAIFWGLGAFFIFFVLYKLYNAGGFFAGKSKKAAIIHTEDTIDTNIDNIDVKQLLHAAKFEKNYKLAIRYLFIQTLQVLALNKVITLHADKTNQYYLQQLNGNMYAIDFSFLINMYEYVWYGAYAIDADKFSLLEKKFNQFNQNISAN